MSFGSVDRRVSRKAVWGRGLLRLVCFLSLATLSACGDLARQGTGSSYLIVSAVEAAPGSAPDEFGGFLFSDVLTIVDDVPTIFNDVGRVTFALGLKDPGGADLPALPTPNNFITINRYNVRYFRTDGRNTPGVDVPYAFDGAITVTVGTGEAEAGFNLVRLQAKGEAPLASLRSNFLYISTIAEITFYGRDQTGREVIATARIGVDFGNYADPE
jgi:hypothetical protein